MIYGLRMLIMAMAIGGFIWGVFKLVEPSGFSWNGLKWLVAEFTVVSR